MNKKEKDYMYAIVEGNTIAYINDSYKVIMKDLKCSNNPNFVYIGYFVIFNKIDSETECTLFETYEEARKLLRCIQRYRRFIDKQYLGKVSESWIKQFNEQDNLKIVKINNNDYKQVKQERFREI